MPHVGTDMLLSYHLLSIASTSSFASLLPEVQEQAISSLDSFFTFLEAQEGDVEYNVHTTLQKLLESMRVHDWTLFG